MKLASKETDEGGWKTVAHKGSNKKDKTTLTKGTGGGNGGGGTQTTIGTFFSPSSSSTNAPPKRAEKGDTAKAKEPALVETAGKEQPGSKRSQKGGNNKDASKEKATNDGKARL